MIMCRNCHDRACIHEPDDLLVIDGCVDINGVDPFFCNILCGILDISNDRNTLNALKVSSLKKNETDDLISCLLIT